MTSKVLVAPKGMGLNDFVAMQEGFFSADGLDVEFDMKTHILVVFTQDKQAIFGALNTLRIPGFAETNVFDSMYDTLDRIDRIPGHKELVVIASGRDTLSQRTLDQTLKKIKGSAFEVVKMGPITTR